MMNRVVALIWIGLWLPLWAFPGVPHRPSRVPRSMSGQRPPQHTPPVVRPEEVNVFVQTDARLFTVMAALLIAGYGATSDRQGESSLPARIRRDLAGIDRSLRARLADYYKVHLNATNRTSPSISGYVGLSLVLSPPPELALVPPRASLPEDIRRAADFAPLVREFYAQSGVAGLIRSYLGQYQPRVQEARRQVGSLIFETLDYLHTLPITRLAGRVERAEGAGSEKPKEKKRVRGKKGEQRRVTPRIRQRTRRLFVLLNPLDVPHAAYIRNDVLNAADTETVRSLGDDYFVIVGSAANLDAVQLGFLQFTLEPLGERFARTIREHTDIIHRLAEQVIGEKAAGETAFSIVNESLVQAVRARLKRRARGKSKDVTADDETLYELSKAYERGAVLVFHFYEQLVPWERAGIDIADYYEHLLRTIDVEREAARRQTLREVRARLEARRRTARRSSANASLGQQLRRADALIRNGELQRARALLEEIVKAHPHHARALYGLAEVTGRMASRINPAESQDEDAAWEQLMTELKRAVQFYRRAMAAASPDEKWLVSRAHVAIGKILEFVGQEEAARSEYEKAIELGDIPNGAYAEAKKRLREISGKT
ncbi:MAG: tetratricopeptide repeat protein [Acidobacteria bacterium]|nr:MAG: tetratricopeptide repeat protein [Acidobacteriota bacterium]